MMEDHGVPEDSYAPTAKDVELAELKAEVKELRAEVKRLKEDLANPQF